jgi:hypothetical protein
VIARRASFYTLHCSAILSLTACASAGVEETSTAFESVELTRTACLGTCPNYSVTVLNDGSVSFEGRSGVEAPGLSRAQLSASRLRKLSSAVLASRHLFEAPENIECHILSLDAPETTIRVVVGGQEHELSADFSCSGSAVDQFHSLAETIDRIAVTHRWIGGARN